MPTVDPSANTLLAPEATLEPQSATLPASNTATLTSAESGLGLPPRYADLGRIASGASGEVRRVLDRLLRRVAAVKVLHPEHATSEGMRARFLAEVFVTADLQHPGIVAVYDRGELADGRLWFAMKEVRGRTMAGILEEVHAASSASEGFREAPSGWTFRRLVDAFARMAQAVGYAHRRGVVHRDLKPENLMAGELGEVLVMDWGLARRLDAGDVAAHAPDDAPLSQETQHGDVLGTPLYMPPEQAQGRPDLHGRQSDVYALGAILYHLLSGRPPYTGRTAIAVLRQVLAGPPVPVLEAARGGPPIPEELAALCGRAMAREIQDRYPDAEVFAREVLSWLDGARRREQAMTLVDRARASLPEMAALRADEQRAHDEAEALLRDVKPFAPIAHKRPAWEREDEAVRLHRAAVLRETAWLQDLHGALSLDPDLPEAHALLADLYRDRLLDAERERRADAAARFEALLRVHDRGRYTALLGGAGAVTLVTDPPGAEVLAERYVLRDRRLVAEPCAALGRTPLHEVRLPQGSYLLRIRAPGRAEVRYPVLIERGGHWDGRPPGAQEPFPIVLPAEGEIGLDDVYVPAGWCWTGGDPQATDTLRRRSIWIEAFVIRRYPVTNGEYLAFLNDQVASGRETEAIAACPRVSADVAESEGEPLAFGRTRSGAFVLPEQPIWAPEVPIVLVDWHAALAYVSWLAARDGGSWRLPDELEREKAARGVDGRLLPWGDHMDTTFACVAESQAEASSRGSVLGFPADESVYGARGMAGNVRDWCANVWTHDGPSLEDGRLRPIVASAEDGDYRVIKGGTWNSPIYQARSAGRFGGRPGQRRVTIGIRPARGLRGPSQRSTCSSNGTSRSPAAP